MKKFKADLLALPPEGVFRRHLILRNPTVISEDSYYRLKEAIVARFELNFTDVLMVGSGKLGFSIKPGRRWQAFADRSDIDIAIVSHRLFESFWNQLHEYFAQGGDWPNRRDFTKYFFRGWIRPDKFPPTERFQLATEWWEFFNELSQQETNGKYQIRGGLYYSWRFLETYHCKCIKDCRNSLEEV